MAGIAALKQRFWGGAGGRNYALDFYRFLAVLCIAAMHFEDQYLQHDALTTRIFRGSFLFVDFFFILSGFFLARSAMAFADGGQGAAGFALRFTGKKAGTLFSRNLVAFCIMVVLALGLPATAGLRYLLSHEWDLLLVGMSGISGEISPNFSTWYLPALLLASFVLSYAAARAYNTATLFIAPLASFLLYSTLAYHYNHLDLHMDRDLFLPAGYWRALAGVALGMALWRLFLLLSQKQSTRLVRVAANLLEWYSLYRLGSFIFFNERGFDNFRALLYLAALILLTHLRLTLLSRFLNNLLSRQVGRLSVSIFLVNMPLVTFYLKTKPAIWGRAIDIPLFLLVVVATACLMELLLWACRAGWRRLRKKKQGAPPPAQPPA